MSGFVRQATCL